MSFLDFFNTGAGAASILALILTVLYCFLSRRSGQETQRMIDDGNKRLENYRMESAQDRKEFSRETQHLITEGRRLWIHDFKLTRRMPARIDKTTRDALDAVTERARVRSIFLLAPPGQGAKIHGALRRGINHLNPVRISFPGHID